MKNSTKPNKVSSPETENTDLYIELVPEKYLTDSEVKFRAVFESSIDAIGVSKMGQHFIVNSAYLEMFGYDHFDELKDLSILELIAPDERPRILDNVQKRSEGENVASDYVTKGLRKDGTAFDMEARVSTYEQNGELFTMAILRDITNRKNAEETLKKSEQGLKQYAQRLETLQAANLALSETLDLDEVLARLLDHLADLVPYDSVNVMLVDSGTEVSIRAFHTYDKEVIPDLIKGIRFDAAINPALNPVITSAISNSIADTREFPGWEHRDGTENIRSWIGVPLVVSGKVIGLYSVDSRQPNYFTPEHIRLAETLASQAAVAIQNAQLHEQTQNHAEDLERRVVERTQALSQSESRYRAIVEDQTEFIVRYLPNTTHTFVNQSYCEFTNRDHDDLLGTRILDEISEADQTRLNRKLASLTVENPILVDEYHRIASDGSEIWERWMDRALYDQDGNLIEYQSVGRDITQRKLAEQFLEKRTQELEKFNKAMVDREMRIINLKEKVNQLHQELGREIPYPPIWKAELGKY